MTVPTPDPSASLTPYQAWVVAAAGQAHGELQTLAVVLVTALVVLIFLAGIVSVAVAFRP